jgi:deoxyribonuclease II
MGVCGSLCNSEPAPKEPEVEHTSASAEPKTEAKTAVQSVSIPSQSISSPPQSTPISAQLISSTPPQSTPISAQLISSSPQSTPISTQLISSTPPQSTPISAQLISSPPQSTLTPQVSYSQSILGFMQSTNTPYQIALKAPHGTETQYISEGKWCYCDNINSWIYNIYSNHQFDHWIVYNDEVEGHNVSSSHGHCKGILAWNSNMITWMIHSVPKFPTVFDSRQISQIAEAELIYGQSFVFLQLSSSLLMDVLTQIKIMNPYVYISTISLSDIKSSESIRETILHENITHIAKARHWGRDIYEHIAERHSGVWLAETWVRGDECKDSERVKDVHEICWPLPVERSTGRVKKYKRTQDHSKYACSDQHVYIGDINRMKSQFHRGGGGIVIKDENISKLFAQIMKLSSN